MEAYLRDYLINLVNSFVSSVYTLDSQSIDMVNRITIQDNHSHIQAAI